jgi:hypothetical protein
MDPRYVLLIEKFMQVLDEEGLIVDSSISDTQTAFEFWSVNKVPGSQRFWPVGIVHLHHTPILLDLSTISIAPSASLRVHK